MIDWFASKLSLLIFITAVAAVLVSFSLVFSENMAKMNYAAAATDIARLIDSVGDGASVNYTVPLKHYTLNITGRILVLNGIERALASFVNQTLIDSAETLRIEKRSGVIDVAVA